MASVLRTGHPTGGSPVFLRSMIREKIDELVGGAVHPGNDESAMGLSWGDLRK